MRSGTGQILTLADAIKRQTSFVDKTRKELGNVVQNSSVSGSQTNVQIALCQSLMVVGCERWGGERGRVVEATKKVVGFIGEWMEGGERKK